MPASRGPHTPLGAQRMGVLDERLHVAEREGLAGMPGGLTAHLGRMVRYQHAIIALVAQDPDDLDHLLDDFRRRESAAAAFVVDGQLPERVKEERNQRLLDVVNALAIAKNQATDCIG